MIKKVFKVTSKSEFERINAWDLESKPFSVTLNNSDDQSDSIVNDKNMQIYGNTKELFDYFEVGKEYCLDLYKKEEVTE